MDFAIRLNLTMGKWFFGRIQITEEVLSILLINFFFLFLERGGGGINGLSMILCLWSPLHPLSKFLAMQDHTQNFEEQLWMGGRREVSFIFYRPVTRSDLKQERAFFRGSVSTFLQLVVATACPNGKLLNWLSFHPGGNCLLNFLSSFHWPNPPPPPPHPLQTLHLIKGCIVIVEPGSPWLY